MKVFLSLSAISLLLVIHLGLADDIVGKTVPPYPTGWQDLGGGCIDDDCTYSLGKFKKNKQEFYYLSQSLPELNHKPQWKVLSYMPMPHVEKGFEVVDFACQLNGNGEGPLDATIIAVVKTIDAELYKTIQSAYRVNTTTGRFENISTDGVVCIKQGWEQ